MTQLRFRLILSEKMTTPLSSAMQDIQSRLIQLLNDMIHEWDIELLEPVGVETRLIASCQNGPSPRSESCPSAAR